MKNQLLIFISLVLAISNTTSAQNGLLDQTFGTQGTITNESFPDPVSQSGVFATANKIYTVLEATDVQIGKMYIRCYHLDGTLDLTFGTNGTFIIENISGSKAVMNADQSKIFIVGRSTYWESGIIEFDIANEVSTTHFYPVEANYNDVLLNISITDNNQIILGGYHLNSIANTGAIRIIKFDENLNVDNTFGVNGSVIFPELVGMNGSTYGLHDMEVDHNGNVFLLGVLDDTHKLIKISNSGAVDASFNSPAVLDTYTYFNDIEITANNQLLVMPGVTFTQYIIKINNDGSADNTFANAGVFQLDSPNPDYLIYFRNVLVEANGNLVAMGNYQSYTSNNFEGKCLLSLDAAGDVNPQFPLVFNDFNYVCGYNFSLNNGNSVFQPDGKILSFDFAACFDTDNTLHHDNILSRYTDELISSVSEEVPSALSIYPNPAHDFINFKHNGENIMNSQIKIYDGMGKVVLSKNLQGHALNVEQLTTGFYSVEITDGSKRNVDRFAKE